MIDHQNHQVYAHAHAHGRAGLSYDGFGLIVDGRRHCIKRSEQEKEREERRAWNGKEGFLFLSLWRAMLGWDVEIYVLSPFHHCSTLQGIRLFL